MTTMKLATIHVWNDLLMMGLCACRKPGQERWRLPVRHDPYAVLRWIRERKTKRREDYFGYAVTLAKVAAP